ncbi:PspC domain-containing protein, partial [Patescibacteria group bacterium]
SKCTIRRIMEEKIVGENKTKPKRLFRSNDNKVVAGVLGGIGKYFNVDPVILRVTWLLIVVFSAFFPGVLVYIFAIFIIPKERS